MAAGAVIFLRAISKSAIIIPECSVPRSPTGNARNYVGLSRLILVRVKRVAIIVTAVVAFGVLLVCGLFYITRPPSEAKMLRSFYAHRSSFEQLRDMLQAEQGSIDISERGHNTPTVTGERLGRYLALLKSIPALAASRWEATPEHPARIVIVLWASGFAGDAVHSGVCWVDDRPKREVSSLDAFIRNPESSIGNGWVFRPIEDKWYLWTNLRTGR
jgi:hypothetical protein